MSLRYFTPVGLVEYGLLRHYASGFERLVQAKEHHPGPVCRRILLNRIEAYGALDILDCALYLVLSKPNLGAVHISFKLVTVEFDCRVKLFKGVVVTAGPSIQGTKRGVRATAVWIS